MERTIVVEGQAPVLLVAPHGPDDTNTDYIAEKAAEEFGAFAVINKGWKRSQIVDCFNDLANCNDIRHLQQDVVREEFLDPILRSVAKIKKKYEEKVFMLILHGCNDNVRNFINDQNLDMIIGFGEGSPPSYSCNIRLKNAFVHYLEQERFGVYEGKSRGTYTGRSKNNLNQFFRKWHKDNNVNSLQLEMTKDLRFPKSNANSTIAGLLSAIDALMLFDDTTTIFDKNTKKI